MTETVETISQRLNFEYREVDALIPYARNPRQHSAAQVDKLAEKMKEIGFLIPVLIDGENEIIAGHGRVLAAKRAGIVEIPTVQAIHLSEKQKRAFVIFDNRITEEGSWDTKLLNEEMMAISEMESTLIEEQTSLENLAAETGFEEKEVLGVAPMMALGEEEEAMTPEQEEQSRQQIADEFDIPEAEIGGAYQIDENAILPSNNRWGIPVLREDMLGTDVPQFIWDEKPPIETPVNKTLFTWHGIKGRHFSTGMGEGGIICFYDDDYKFELVWNDPVQGVQKLRLNRWGSVVMPDFSIDFNEPLVSQMWQMYKSFWCARLWQEAGINVIPNLTFTREETYEFCFTSIPKNPPVCSTQVRTMFGKQGEEADYDRGLYVKGLTEAIKRIQPQNLILYGGEKHREKLEPSLPQGPRYHFLTARMDMRLGRYAKKEGD
jgi:hypothetical protein